MKLDSTGWLAAHEFEMTRQAWKGGCHVPAPARRVENMFSMRYLGDEQGPAPRLHDIRTENPRTFLDEVLVGVEALAGAGVVHADLSPFNILVYNEQPWFIDFSEAVRVDRTGSVPWMRLEEARAALNRGMDALRVYFGKMGVEVESEPFVSSLLKSLDRFGVLQL